jgi:hypothetical protein
VKVSAVVSKVEGGWLAECEDVDLAGEGPTREAALSTLRTALEEYFHRSEAVAPPTDAPRETIEIVVLGEDG